MPDTDISCHILSTKSLIKTTGFCKIRPEKGSKWSPRLVNDVEEEYYDSVEESSHFHEDEQAPDSFPSHLICTESRMGWNNQKSRLRTVISLQ